MKMKFVTISTILTILVCVNAAKNAIYAPKGYQGNQYTAARNLKGPYWSLIFPGTKWCGSGAIAENENDLGISVETDKCCRAHDLCDDLISAGESKHNLTNDAPYTRLHCECDFTFLNCLLSSKDLTASIVGRIYFTLISTKCYKLEYPIIRCIQHYPFPRTCMLYELDPAKEKLYQWFDVPHWPIKH